MGIENIQKTEVKDVIIVLGPSGVGKSTLVQFIGNDTNTLRAECEWDECSIIDETGTIGDDIISKTFLPNLVFRESKNTPFYDMPGFNDNRNASIEIANSFFIRQILDEAERIKILILARYESFTVSAKQDFINLLKNLSELILHPEKLKGAMSIVATISPENTSHNSTMGKITKFLKEDLLLKLDEIFSENEQYRTTSKSILENLLQTETENYWDAKYVSYFLSPNDTGLLSELEQFNLNKKLLEEIVWDRLQFAPKHPEDFGLPLSDSALRLLENTGTCVSYAMVSHLESFAKSLEDTIAYEFSNVANGNSENISYLMDLIMNLTSSDFTFNDTGSPLLSSALNVLYEEITNYQVSGTQDMLQTIEDHVLLFEFIELTSAYIKFEPQLWFSAMQRVKPNVVNAILPDVALFQNLVISSLTEESKTIAAELLESIESSNDVYAKVSSAKSVISKVQSTIQNIENDMNVPGRTFHDFLANYLTQLDTLRNCDGCSTIPEMDIIQLLELLHQFPWRERSWTDAIESELILPFENESYLSDFLIGLFKDLSSPSVQTGPTSAIHSWWAREGKISEGNWNEFVKISLVAGFEAPLAFDTCGLKQLIFHSANGKARMDSLLGLMLNSVYSCSNSVDIAISGPIISLDRLQSCIKPGTTKTITLLATYKTFGNANINGSQIHANNVDIIMMSPHILVSKNAIIDLSGTAGNNEGKAGGPAGTQYSLFKTVAASDGSATNKVVSPAVNGGLGANGSAGVAGNAGTKGANANSFDASSDDCAAWEDRRIQIRNYQNTCNTCTTSGEPIDDSCYCRVKGEITGVSVDIYGKAGGVGGNGGKGIDGSCGGPGGQSYAVLVQELGLPKSHVNGVQGRNGMGGPGGPGGPGGLAGDTLKVQIDHAGVIYNHRYCEELRRSSTPSSTRAPSGQTGATGNTCTTLIPMKSVNTHSVGTNFNLYKKSFESLLTNEFLSAHAISMLSLLDLGSPF